MATKRLYVHDDRSMWAVVTETDDGRFLHKFGDGDERLFLDPPPTDWQLLAQFEDA